MHSNPAEMAPARAMHELKLTSEQMMLTWQLTEMAKPNDGNSADLLVSLRNRLRPVILKIRKEIAEIAASSNGRQRAVPELVSHGRSA